MEENRVNVYDVMEKKLKDDAMSIKSIKKLGKELIEKMKMIDSEIAVVNPNHIMWNELTEENRNKMVLLYKLKEQYRIQFDMIGVVLGQSNEIVHYLIKDKFKEAGLDNKFFVNDLED